MIRQINEFNEKLVRHGLVLPDKARLYAIDDVLVASHEDEYLDFFRAVLGKLNIMGLIFAPPAPPWDTFFKEIMTEDIDRIYPEDCETKTLLHDIPVTSGLDVDEVVAALRERKGVIIRGHGIVTHGAVTLEQAFIWFSSIMHSIYVKYFVDFDRRDTGDISDEEQVAELDKIIALMDIYKPFDYSDRVLMKGPQTGEDVYKSMCECGRMTVDSRLVDSTFGNVSYTTGGIMHISQTMAPLDELESCIDPVPLDNSATVGITSSTELPGHIGIYDSTKHAAILHGHPKFSVIMSMLCDEKDCEKTDCYRECDSKRFVRDIPIVVGEMGAGGLNKTVPPAIVNRRGVIVYGHGVFTTSEDDFNVAFQNLLQIELDCRAEYIKRQRAQLNAK
jgi:ribulose-5-phosphate 4-epimerase/fuculose-1-phosphate aldolase